MNTLNEKETKVLLVDDDKEEYAVVRKYLRSSRAGNYQIQWAATLEEALAALQESSYDVCLLDYHLGENTGIDVLTQMQANHLEVPVVLLTGQGSLKLDIEAMEMGAFDYLEKGELTPALLDRSIRYAMENHRARTALRTANEELEERVHQRTAELRRSNQDLEQFAKIVARDLQEPLRAITQQIEQIREQEKASRELELDELESLLRTARNMELMVESVLNYSGVGREIKPFVPVDLTAVVHDVCNDLATTIHEANAKIEVAPLPTINGDLNLISGLFENLIDNAIKFRGTHPLQIRIACEQKGKNWLCSVGDNGIGMPDNDTEDVFLMFHRGSGEPEQAGVGLGLAMCRKITQYHGGRIWVDSEFGHGSTFYFTFPVA